MSAELTDLTHLANTGLHLHAHNCIVLKSIANLKAALSRPGYPHVEYVTRSITNPRKVTCLFCRDDMLNDSETIIKIHENYSGWQPRSRMLRMR